MFQFDCKSSVRGSSSGLCQALPGAIHLERNADYWVLIFVRDKCLYIEIDGVEYAVEEDQILFLPAGTTHRGTRPYESGLVFYWVHFFVDDTDTPLPYDLPQHTTLKRPNIMVEYMRRYLDDYKDRRLAKLPPRSDILLTLMLLEIAGNHSDETTLPETTVALAEKLYNYVTNRYDQDITVASIAERFGYHPDHISRVFKRAMGHSLTDEIHQRRIDKASQLLIESQLKVNEVGYKVGYNDRTYFHKMFKRFRQTTPSSYRRLHTKAHMNGRDDN